MAQAAALNRLIDELRAVRDLGIMCYSGYTLEHLKARGTPEQRELLARIDLLVDGPYLSSRHADLLWRGSANQRLIPLSPRYLGHLEQADRGAGLEFLLTPSGRLTFTGIPPWPGMLQDLELRAP